MPRSWIETGHQFLGLGQFPTAPITEYFRVVLDRCKKVAANRFWTIVRLPHTHPSSNTHMRLVFRIAVLPIAMLSLAFVSCDKKKQAEAERELQKAGEDARIATEKAVEASKRAADAAVDKTKEAAANAKDATKEAVGDAKEAAARAAERTKAATQEGQEKLKNALDEATRKAAEGIEKAKEKVKEETGR
jgi:hypothetical protein